NWVLTLSDLAEGKIDPLAVLQIAQMIPLAKGSTLQVRNKAGQVVTKIGAEALAGKGGRNLGARSGVNLAAEAEKGLGKLQGVKITPTKADIAVIEKHLETFGPDAANEAMLGRIKAAQAEGRALEGADAHFYAHELLEQKVMHELTRGGHYTPNEAYKVAHP